jgi:predicted CXXCH cytochrome family protein
MNLRRFTLLAACSAAVLLTGAVPALADNGPHSAGAGVLADDCAGCHRVHTAKSDTLTTEAQPQLCYTCHGTTGTGADTDVQAGVSRGRAPGALRGGGFRYALIDSASATSNGNGNVPVRGAGAAVTSTHSVDGSDGTAWGNGPISSTENLGSTIQLRCGSCHDPHGNGNYRILRAMPSQSGAVSPGVAIAEAANATKDYTTTNYWQVADANEPRFIANVSAWCSTCHTRYLASSDTSQEDSGDAVFTFRHISDETAPGQPNCIQCHVSHGSNAATGSPARDAHGARENTPADDSKLLRVDNQGTCQMCHQHQ